jgi:hypothetical protein
MKNIICLILALALLPIGVSVSAEKVYESVDSKGNVEFSDQPSPEAKQIDVDPNVVNTAPIPPGELSTSPAPAAPNPAPETPAESGSIQETGVGTDYEAEQRHAEERNAEILHEEGSQEPGRGEPAGEAVRGGVHRR